MAGNPAKKRGSSGGRKNATRTPVRAPSGNTHLGWFMSGVLSGLFIAFIAYLGLLRPAQTDNDSLAGNSSGNSEANTEEREGFSFYQSLPETEVQVNVVPVDVAVTETEQRKQDNRTYLLQVASFQDPAAAEGLMVDVMLMNLDAKVVPAVVNGQTWYRVQVGPLQGRQARDQACDILMTNDLNCTASLAN